jgi:hypothetical protein
LKTVETIPPVDAEHPVINSNDGLIPDSFFTKPAAPRRETLAESRDRFTMPAGSRED